MKIIYEVKLAACLAFNDHLLKTSPLMKKTIRTGQMWWASGPLLGGLAIAIVKGIPPDRTLMLLSMLALALSLPMFCLYPRYFKRCRRKQVKSICEGSGRKGFLGVHELEITDRCLTVKTQDHENRIEWKSITRIDSTSDYTFVYLGENTAHIIPKDHIIEGDYSLFVRTLQEVFETFQVTRKI